MRKTVAHTKEGQMQRERRFIKVVGPILLIALFVGIYVIGRAPVMSADAPAPTGDCQRIDMLYGLLKKQGRIAPGACPPPLYWGTGWAPPPGAIQINPTAGLPDGAICEATFNNACSNQGTLCSPGKTCKDTWDSSTHTCMCQCRT